MNSRRWRGRDCTCYAGRRAGGFTLIELLVAMSLTVLIGAISYRFLDASIRVQEQGEAAQQSLTALEQTWQLLTADLQNSIDRPVMIPATGADFLSGYAGKDSRRPSMMSAQFADRSLAQLLSQEGAQLWFSRHGWVNPLNEQRSEIQRILYRLDENGNLFRDYWQERNQDLSAPPEGSRLMLENVRSFQIGFLAGGQIPDNNAWLTRWPPAPELLAPQQNQNGGTNLLPVRHIPAAVRISLELESLGEGVVIERIFLLAGL
ncbi:MAG: type II secretion system minor pseudopilin GspJ [Pseudohongiella sp.]|nr:type II secretion system minor pseudopilin GspJ [Pseudohongiella sp.]